MSEQGFGDTLQFSRYALWLQQRGFDVTLLSQPALVPLLQEAVGLANVVGQPGHQVLAKTLSSLDAPSGCVAKPASTESLDALQRMVTSKSSRAH